MRAPDFWTTGAGPWPRLLAPLGTLTAAAGALRHVAARPVAAGIPVICVGNLTAGGAGKTPVTLALAERLRDREIAAHLLARGYGGTLAGPVRVDPARHGAAEVGDEALLLARAAPAWVARDRVRGARAARDAGAEALVLDDGFQDPALAKDLAVVVVDGATGFGNGRPIPAGPLREPVARGLGRADAVVVMGADRAGVAARVAAVRPALPVLAASLRPAADGARLAGRPVWGFAGIGRPEKLRETLLEIGAEVRGFRAFPDHHPYSDAELAALRDDARAAGAALVTTAKDAVRLAPAARAAVEVLEVAAAFADEDAVERLLDRVTPASAAPEGRDRAGSGTG